MAASYEIFRDTGLVVVTCSGPADAKELIDLFTLMRSDPHYSHSLDVLWDCTGRTVPFTSEEIRKVVEHVDSYSSQGQERPKRAFVAPKDAVYGMVRVYEMHSFRKSDVEVEVFRDRDKALGWLGRQGMGDQIPRHRSRTNTPPPTARDR